MATLTSEYQYLGISPVMTSVSGKLSYYLLLYGKTTADQITGIHTVTILGRLASTSTGATFYMYATSHSGTIAGITAFSGTKEPTDAWELSNFSAGGVTFKTGTDIGSGSVQVDCTDGLSKDIVLSFTWSMPSNDSDSYTPKAGTSRTVSVTATLPAIPRASQPSCITSPNHTRNVGKFGDTIRIHMNKKSSNFTHYVQFSFGTLLGEIASNVVDYVDWQIPLELIRELKSYEKNGWGRISVETFSNGRSIGSNSVEFEATVPDVEATKPTVNMVLAPVGSLPSAFAGLYIQGLTKVKATLSAEGKYGANINSYLMKADGVLYDSEYAYTSSYLTSYGEKEVYGYATDSRENTGETSQKITVIPYSYPKLENATAVRCDKNGNESESGTYLKIAAKRSYSPCISNGVQKNFCKIHYRYSRDKYNYSEWKTILDGNNLNSDEITTAPLLDGILSAQATYVVHIQAIDDVGKTAETFVTLQTDEVYMHRDGARNALGLGKYNERDNAVDSAWDFYMNGNQIKGLAEPSEDSDAVPKSYIVADIKLRKELYSQGWYKIGVITGDMCSVTSFIMGGVWGYGKLSPSMVDITTFYNEVSDYVRITTPYHSHITKMGITMESNMRFGVYVYYNNVEMNRIDINVNTRMGGFEEDNWTLVNFTDSDFIKIITLTT